MPKKTIDEQVIANLQQTAKTFATRRAKVERWHAAQLAKLTEKRRVALDAIDTVEDTQLDAIFAGYTAEKSDWLMQCAGLRVDAGIDAVEPVE